MRSFYRLLLHRILVPSIVLVGLVWALPGVSLAQLTLQSPAEYLGYGMGERFTPHHKIVEYARYIAANSDRVDLTEFGKSFEGRPLLYLTISTAQNLSNKDEIRQNNLKLTGLLEGQASSNQKSIVWLSYNVHGNEAVASEAALWTLWELADPANAKTGAWLEHTVVIMDPCLNPDGRDRYVNWYDQMLGFEPNMNMDAREHSEPWPGGRSNHYYFDMNRDWAWQTQRETQARAVVYHQWMPHVHIDFHEMGMDSPYFFAPSAEPFHEYVTPWQRQFQTTIGMKNVHYFDKNAWLYYTREVFDLFAPSYGDTWPTMNGAIGITVEQGGSGRAGLAGTKANGDTLSFYDRVIHQHVTGLASVEATAEHHTQVIKEFKAFFDKARANPPGKHKTYVIKASNKADDLNRLKQWLDANYIRYGYAKTDMTTTGFHYRQASDQRVTVQAGDLVIPAAQPKGVQVAVLFEPRTTIVDSLTYDFTAWSVPYIRGLDAYALAGTVAMEAKGPSMAASSPVLNEKPYAYLVSYNSLEDTQFLAKLLRKKIHVRFANKPFEMEGKRFDRGSLVITREDNEDRSDFDAVVMSTAAQTGRVLNTTQTGFATKGSDLGSRYGYVGHPRVLSFSGEGTQSGGVGEVWHFFEQQIGYPITMAHATEANRVDLSKYDVIVLASSINTLRGDAGMTRLMDWVREGGRLILMGSAVGMAVDTKEFGDLKYKKGPEDDHKNPQPGYGGRERRAVSSDNTGSIYKVKLDPTHPLAYGYGDTYFSMKLNASALEYSKDGWNVGIVPKGGYVSGFVGHKIKPQLEESANFIVYERGRGSVVILHDNPLYRAFWESGKLMAANAVFFVGRD